MRIRLQIKQNERHQDWTVFLLVRIPNSEAILPVWLLGDPSTCFEYVVNSVKKLSSYRVLGILFSLFYIPHRGSCRIDPLQPLRRTI